MPPSSVPPPANPRPNPLRVGERVVVRYRLPAGAQPPLTDVVGEVTAVGADRVTIASAGGPVTIERGDFVAVKAVPPRATRPGRPHRTVAAADLERVMARGWAPVEQKRLGDWVLRASSGFTSRANAVLAIGDPGVSTPEAVGRAEAWYAARGLPAQLQVVVDEPTGAVHDARLGEVLQARGYALVKPSRVLTAASATVPPLAADDLPVTADARLTLPWLEAYARQRPVVPGVSEQVLTGSDGQLFLSVTAGEVTGSAAPVAVARMAIHPGWAGIHALWVDPAYRRQGLGALLTRTVAHLAREHEMASIYLQVEQDNTAALSLYETLGFEPHHTYAYAVGAR